MRKINIRLLLSFLILTVLVINGCQLFKSEDEKISDALIGRSYEDDLTEDNGKITDITHVYFPDGTYKSELTLEFEDGGSSELSSVKMKFSGTWKVKNKYLYNTYDKVETDPEYFVSFVKESIRKKNTPSKIISYDDAKIQYEDSDGEIHFIKKTF